MNESEKKDIEKLFSDFTYFQYVNMYKTAKDFCDNSGGFFRLTDDEEKINDICKHMIEFGDELKNDVDKMKLLNSEYGIAITEGIYMGYLRYMENFMNELIIKKNNQNVS